MLHLRVMQKALQLRFFFLFSSFSTVLLDRLAEGFTYVSEAISETGHVRQVPGKLHCIHRKMIVAKSSLNLKFWVWEHGMSCVLEQIIMAKLSVHIQSWISYECRIPHLWQNYRNCRNVHKSTTAVSMVIKLGMVVTYYKGYLLIKSHDPFVT